jgi:hypothetical protein
VPAVEANNTAEAKIPANQALTDISEFSEIAKEESKHRKSACHWLKTPTLPICIAPNPTYFNGSA